MPPSGRHALFAETGEISEAPGRINAHPVQMGIVKGGFAEAFVKIFKVGGHPLMDDRPIKRKSPLLGISIFMPFTVDN